MTHFALGYETTPTHSSVYVGVTHIYMDSAIMFTHWNISAFYCDRYITPITIQIPRTCVEYFTPP